MSESPAGPTTLANWQDPPFNRWGFLHVDQLLPTATVRRGGSGEPLVVAERPILDLPVSRLAGSPESTVADVLADTETDAFLVLQDGVIVHESYASNVATDSRHLLMSVTKSYIGAVAGILAERGVLDLDGPIAAPVRSTAM